MSKVTVVCDRCEKNIDGKIVMNSGTAGFYQVWKGIWAKYARPNERNVCDACMWRDPAYIADYSRIGIGGPTTEELKAELEKIVQTADTLNRKLIDCLGEFESVGPAESCWEWANELDDAEMELLKFWRQHRDRIAFVVWDNTEEKIPGHVITAGLYGDREAAE